MSQHRERTVDFSHGACFRALAIIYETEESYVAKEQESLSVGP